MAESPPISDDTFRRNVAAIAAGQPALAAMLEQLPIPAGVRPAVGRDGGHTFLVPDTAGALNWLGGTSMPNASSEELFGQWEWSGGNVVLAGVLSGLEPLVVARRLPDHAAAFVVEPDPLSLKLALHLHVYAAMVEAGTLVFLVEPGLEGQLTSLFEANPGYEMPRQILPCPSRSPAQVAGLQSRLERVGARILQLQVRSMERSAAAIRGRHAPVPGGPIVSGLADRQEHRPPRVAVVSTAAGRAVAERAARVARGMNSLGWPHVVCVPDRPSRAHVAARLRAIEQLDADWVLFLEAWPGETRKLLPSQLPVVAWFTQVASRPSTDQAIGPYDLFFAETTSSAAGLVRAGAPADRVHRLPPAADVDPSAGPAIERARRSHAVAVVASLPDDRPEAADVRLPSHVSLWQALQTVLAERAGEYREPVAASYLEEAQKRCGVSLAEPSVRDSFLQCLRIRIAPAAVARHTVDSVARAGFDVSVFGHGWEGRRAQNVMVRGELPTGASRQEAFDTVSWLVLPTADPLRIEISLEASACGVAVAMRAGPSPLAEEHPGLKDVAACIHAYRTTAELLAVLTERRPRSGGAVRETAELVRRGHCVAERLKTIRQMLANSAAADAVAAPGNEHRTYSMTGST